MASFRPLLCIHFFLLIVRLSLADETSRIRGENGEISLAIAAPLTNNGEPYPDPGWVHMASALLAVDHFNERNPVVVKQLEELADCPFQITNVSVIDTGTNTHKAMKSMLQRLQQAGGMVDAIAGPYNEQPALELSVLATGMESPMVAFRGLDHNLVLPNKHPFYSQVNPDLYGEMEFLVEFLRYTNRTNYIAIIYTNEDSVLQRTETLQTLLKEKLNCNQVKAYSYLSVGKAPEGHDRDIKEAVKMVAQTGFRTIIMLTTTPDLDTPGVGAAALDYGLDQGGHFWIIPGGLDATGTDKNGILRNYRDKPEGGFLRGAAFLYMFDYFSVNPDNPFSKVLGQQNASFVQRLRLLNPVPSYAGKPFCRGYGNHTTAYLELIQPTCEPADDFFQSQLHLVERIENAYDATMAIGIGACLTIANKTNTTAMTGEEHVAGIQSVDFRGASGQVKFRNRPGTPGSRDSLSVYYGIMNLIPYGEEGPEALPTSYIDPDTMEWVDLYPHVYSDGTNNPPLLRSVPEQNYLDPGVRAVGLALMSVALFFIAVSAIWVCVFRHHRVVIAAQPPFLYVLCLGSTLSALVILTQSFDESYGWDDPMLDAACVATPWLFFMGYMVTFGTLFTKLWRVNKVLQFKRTMVKVQHVVWPALFLFLSAIAILASWTATDDFGWVREEVDEVSGETIGRCTCTGTNKSESAFLLPVAGLCLVSTALTCIMAWKTSDVDDMYSESKWIFTLVLVQFQVMVVGFPVVAILQTVSTNGRYIGLSLIVWTFPMSTMGLIFGPKIHALRRERIGASRKSSRGSSQGIKVSGLSYLTNEPQARLSNAAGGMGSSEQAAGSSEQDLGSFQSPRIQTVIIE